MDQKFKEFKESVIHPKGEKRNFKVKGSFGVYDAYKLIRKNHWFDIGRPVLEKEFYAIIRKVNDRLAENVANGEEVTFPSRMGKLELRKHEVGVGIVDGKLKITYPIDWHETLKLWYEDEEAKKNKTLVRMEDEKFIYSVKYLKGDATYENKTFYQFVLNNRIKKALKQNIKEEKTDTLWLKRYNTQASTGF